MKDLTVKNENTDLADLDSVFDGGTGFEGMDSESISLPFLKLAQKLSAQADKQDESYIEGLEAGMFFTSISNKVMGNSVRAIPLSFHRTYVEWKPDRGGFVKVYSVAEFNKIKNQYTNIDGKFIAENGNEVSDTRNYFLMLPDYLEEGIILLSLSSSGISASKKWNALQQQRRLPTGQQAVAYMTIWTLRSTVNKNDKGAWYTVKAENPEWITNGIVKDIKTCRQLVLDYGKSISNIDFGKNTDIDELNNTEF